MTTKDLTVSERTADRLAREWGGRRPRVSSVGDETVWTLAWDPDLTAEEEAQFDALVAVLTVGGGADLDISMIADEIDVLKMYRGSARGTPTVAQHERAIRALIEVVRYLIKAR